MLKLLFDGKSYDEKQIYEFERRDVEMHDCAEEGTALYLACVKNKPKSVKALLDIQGFLNYNDEEGWDETYESLKSYRKALEPAPYENYTLGAQSAHRRRENARLGFLMIIEMLLSKLVNVHGGSFLFGDFARAVADGDCTLVAIYLRSNDDFKDASNYESNPFGKVGTNVSMAEVLLRNAFGPNEEDDRGYVALVEFLDLRENKQSQEALEIVNLLLDHNADPNARHPTTNQTAFSVASKWHREMSAEEQNVGLRLCTLLLNRGAQLQMPSAKSDRQAHRYYTEAELDMRAQWYGTVLELDPRRLALGMNLHERLGAGSLLQQIPPDLQRIIVGMLN